MSADEDTSNDCVCGRFFSPQMIVPTHAICPHAGCFVAYAADRKVFQCPCHTSSFQLDGTKIEPSPSPRNMDELAVQDSTLKEGEVWVQFVNYYPGTEHREEKPT